ncbi:MAG: hypothetical protein ACKVWV_07225 [Planctomycetota bacterium]
MKSFFKDMNVARAFILLALIGSVVLGFTGWRQAQALTELRERSQSDLEPLVAKIQELGKRHTQLSKSMRAEGLAGQSDPESYVRKTAMKDKVEVGDVKIDRSEDPRTQGVIDRKYRIRPADRDQRFDRVRIANFLYSLEADSPRRVKVTDIQIQIGDKKIKPQDIPEDRWTFEAEITSRQRTEEKPK